MKPSFWIFLLLLMVPDAGAEETPARSPYAGQELRPIKSLSSADIRQLRNGEGWGLARPAELNGMPGPKHVLELKHEIDLTPAQEQSIRALFSRMESDAIRLGLELIELEQALDDEFADREITPASLAGILNKIARVQRDLRYTHLVAHLQTPEILTPEQVAAYNRLRGYQAKGCEEVPEGHDAKMWRQHNGCE
ncbi:MAG: hypothetical protein KJO54_05420 [Gammaproteobacteria bacterium]|nr:hypothetical protein [Gammaproteobacteria bacterium]